MTNPSIFDQHWQQRCREWAAAAGSDGAHDLTHIERVVATATRLGQEANANLDVILPAAWLHDVVMVDKRDPRRSQASRLSADKAVALLGAAGYPETHLQGIHHAILSHSWSAGIEPVTLEARIVQDADRLDALGAIGLSRCLMLGGQWNRALYHDADPLGEAREWDDNQYNLDHLFIKLQHLPGQLRTDAGRAEGQRRWAWMQGYLDQLAHELGLNP